MPSAKPPVPPPFPPRPNAGGPFAPPRIAPPSGHRPVAVAVPGAPTPGRIVLYGFRSVRDGSVIERPAIVVRVTGDTLSLSVMVDGVNDYELLQAVERDSGAQRTHVLRQGVPPSRAGEPVAFAWRWPPR
jgi:hypothetical protein